MAFTVCKFPTTRNLEPSVCWTEQIFARLENGWILVFNFSFLFFPFFGALVGDGWQIPRCDIQCSGEQGVVEAKRQSWAVLRQGPTQAEVPMLSATSRNGDANATSTGVHFDVTSVSTRGKSEHLAQPSSECNLRFTPWSHNDGLVTCCNALIIDLLSILFNIAVWKTLIFSTIRFGI